jgi:hypothetical protein
LSGQADHAAVAAALVSDVTGTTDGGVAAVDAPDGGGGANPDSGPNDSPAVAAEGGGEAGMDTPIDARSDPMAFL